MGSLSTSGSQSFWAVIQLTPPTRFSCPWASISRLLPGGIRPLGIWTEINFDFDRSAGGAPEGDADLASDTSKAFPYV